MHLNIDSLVTEIDEAQLIYQTSTLIQFKLNLNKLCNSEYKLDYSVLDRELSIKTFCLIGKD